MIRAMRTNAMAQDDATMVTGWNISPNVAYYLVLLPGPTSCGVLLYAEDQVTLVATGAALTGVGQPCVLLPQSTQTIGMVDADLGRHLLITTDGTESQRTIRIGPAVDLPDEIHPVYADNDMTLARATAAIDDAAHYRDEITATCLLGLGVGLGDIVSVPVDGVVVIGQVESITWTGTPDGTSEQAIIRRNIAIAPDAFVEPATPLSLTDDAATTDAETVASGNVLTNDDDGLAIVAVNGLVSNVDAPVAGSDGGLFVVAEDGSWTFDPNGNFSALEGSETADTSVTYHASDGVSEAMGTLTITVSAGGIETDPMWDDVALLIQAPETGTTIVDAKGKTVTPQGNVAVLTTLGYPTIYFDGVGDRLAVGAAGDFNILHNGTAWTMEFLLRPVSVALGTWLLDTARGTFSNKGILMGFGSVNGQIRLLIANGSPGGIIDVYFTGFTFAINTNYSVAFTFDHALPSNNLKMFVNGSSVGSGTKNANTPSPLNSEQLFVSQFHVSYPNNNYKGHMQYLRITEGVRYVGAYTPPIWPLPTA